MSVRIGICGLGGTGKTTVGKVIAEKYGVPFRSVGDFFREVAQRRGVSDAELESLAMTDSTVDHEIDERTRVFASEHNDTGYVIEGRRVRIVVPEAKCVLCVANDGDRFQRLFDRDRRKREWTELQQAMHFTLDRERFTSTRYEKLYGQSLDMLCDPIHYPLTLNASLLNQEQMVEVAAVFIDSVSFRGVAA